jgi:LCP family protein required for cell wall assembly
MVFYDYRKKRKRRSWLYSSGSSHHSSHSHHSHHHHRRRWRTRVLRAAGIFALVLVLLVGGCYGAFRYLKSAGQKSLMEVSADASPDMGELQDTSGLVSYQGHHYRYNDEMINILCMGIDQYTSDETESETEYSFGESGQADTIFLLSLNCRDDTMKLTGISRDTMTEIRTYDYQGNYLGKVKNHLGLAYAFGDGGSESGEFVTEAVSDLLYGLPIHGYVAVRLDAIQKLNDSVGGVTVTLNEDMILGGQSYAKGDTVLLQGSQAQNFVQTRDTETTGSNNERMERQKQYAVSFLDEARAALKKRPLLAADLYRELTADMVTGIGLDEAVYLASLIANMSFSMDDISMLAGETKQGSVYDEFYLDEDALLEQIFDTFYIEVDE